MQDVRLKASELTRRALRVEEAKVGDYFPQVRQLLRTDLNNPYVWPGFW
jgi:hypothetical protein